MTPESAFLCLTLNIYHEARGEPKAGQIAVAMVTMNRAEWETKNVCKVVYKRHQFSWTRNKAKAKLTETTAWKKANRIAKAVMEGKHDDPTMGATHFHTKSVKPAWSYRLERTVRIGGHIFYTTGR